MSGEKCPYWTKSKCSLSKELCDHVDAWQYSDCTRYLDVELKKTKGKKGKVTQASFLEFGDKMAEQIWNDGVARYAIWDGENVNYQDDIEYAGQKFVPMNDDAIVEGAVLLPSMAEDYGDLDALVKELSDYVHRYVDVSENYEKFAVWYILLTWVYDKLNTLTYLRALGDTGTGKSRFLDVIGGVCYKACIVSGSITPAPIYRMIRRWRGSIILDEADFRDSSEKHEVITILNCGFERNRPVIRCEKEHPDDLQFLPTFSPKIFASRSTFKDSALESRCLTEVMRQTKRGDVPYLLSQKFYEEQRQLRNKLLMFRFRSRGKIDPEMAQNIDLGDVEPRLKQAMASFAVLFGNVPTLVSEFRDFLSQYNQDLIEERARSFEGMVVASIFALMDDGVLNIAAKDVVGVLKTEHGLEKVTPQRVGKTFKSLGLRTEKRRVGDRVSRFLIFDDDVMGELKKRYGFVSDVSSVSSVEVRGQKIIITNDNTVSCDKEYPIDMTQMTHMVQKPEPEILLGQIVGKLKQNFEQIKGMQRETKYDFTMLASRTATQLSVEKERVEGILKKLIRDGEIPIILPPQPPPEENHEI